MEKILFNATFVYSSKNEEDKYYMFGLADDQYDYKNYVILQKNYRIDQIDILTQTDSYYFEVNGQEYSSYKCCKKVVLTGTKIEFLLISKKIRGLENVTVNLQKSAITTQDIEYLKLILGDVLVISDFE